MEDNRFNPRRSFVLGLLRQAPGPVSEIVSTTLLYRGGAATEGWLVVKENQSEERTLGCNFKFTYLGDNAAGLPEYRVYGDMKKKTLGDIRGGYLEISRNGYLGLYGSSSGQRWTLELGDALIEEGTQQLWYPLGLKSADGQAVRQVWEEKENYLNVFKGKDMVLLGRVLRLL